MNNEPQTGEAKPSKEELKKLQEIKRQRKIAKDQLFPFLEMSTKSVEEAKNMLQIFAVTIRQAFNNKQQISTVGSLKIDRLMDSKNPDFKKYKFLLDLFKDETITISLGLVEGLQQAIDAFIRKEMAERELKSLKTDFL